MRGATAHDWPVGNTRGRCALGAPLISCAGIAQKYSAWAHALANAGHDTRALQA